MKQGISSTGRKQFQSLDILPNKTVWRLLKKLDLPYNCTSIYLKEYESGYNKGIWAPMFIAALFTTAKLWKQPRCPTTDEWIKKMWYLYTMEFYSATKNGILSFAGKWMELENIILSEVSQAQRAKSCVLPHVRNVDLKQM
jgi:hypothetical protein